ncbi:MAG: hypothetical protein EHM40_11075 [Chloroflexi bacterium]|nr:MAG: hypothetical protein EHM40_11075 [Chloroflexota bacterium]
MKKFFSLFLIIMVCVLVLSACTPPFARTVVELPGPIQLAILAGVTFVVGFIFTKIAEALPFLSDFLGQYVDEVAVAVAGGIVLWIQNLLNAIPLEWEGVANAALTLIVAILAAIQLLKLARKARVPGFRS